MPTTSEDFEENYCGDPTKYKLINECTNLSVSNAIGEQFNKECAGKEICDFHFEKYVKYNKDLKDKCNDFYSRLYINYSCDLASQTHEN